MKWLKRVFVILFLIFAGLVASYSWLIDQLGGAFDEISSAHQYSNGAQQLIDDAYTHIDPARLMDYHVHTVGFDTDSKRAWVNPKLISWSGLHHKVKGDVYMSGSGVSSPESATTEYVTRLTALIDRIPAHGLFQLLAFDYHYGEAGVGDSKPNLKKSEFYVSNDYVYELSQTYPDTFVPAISVHPLRMDAVDKLDYWAKRGVRFVKWLPNAQGMDASSPRITPYFDRLKQNDMVLLTHVGEEQAVEAAEDQALGNPLKFRNALDGGVKIVMAHAASLGKSFDHEQNKQPRDNFDLFLRLMDDPRYRGNLFADISAITQFNRLPGPLLTLLERTDLHPRLVNGSDYPLPAINVVISTLALEYYGFINAEQRKYLNEIYRQNPLLFDFVLKRTLRHPETGAKFPPSVFMMNSGLE